MKKVISYVLLVLILTAGVIFGLAPALSAQASGEAGPINLRWDTSRFGFAQWDAVQGATGYNVQLYRQNGSGFEAIGAAVTSPASTASVSLASNIQGGKAGIYTFTVSISTETPPVPTEKNPLLEYEKLSRPASPMWDWNTNDLVRAAWNSVNGAETYTLKLYKKGVDVAVATFSGIGTNSKSFKEADFKGYGDGEYTFTVQAVSSKMESSEETVWPSGGQSLTYPVILDQPENVRWSHHDGMGEYGIARWDPVDNATGYSVQFYKVEEKLKDDVDAEGNPIKVRDYYYYKAMGTPMVLSATSTHPIPSNYVTPDKSRVSGSGTYMFTVMATSSRSGVTNSPVSRFLVEGYDVAENASLNPDNLVERTRFDYIAVENIFLDFDADGVKDTDQNQVLYLATGNYRTIQVLVEPANAMRTFIWDNSKNSAAFDHFAMDDNVLTMRALTRGRLEISVTDTLSGKTQNIVINASEPPTRIVISGKNSYTSNDSGDLSLSIEPETAYKTPEYIDWISSDPNVATVDNGRVTAKNVNGIAYATITARSKLDDRTKGEYLIAVSNTQIMPSEISILGNNTVSLKGKLQLTANVYAGTPGSQIWNFAYNKDVSWTSSDEKKATVDSKGLVTPKALGEVTITATSLAYANSGNLNDDRAKKSSIKITVVEEPINITKVSLSGGSTVKVGESLSLKAAITPANATKRDLVWTFTSPNHGDYGQLNSVDELNYTLTGLREGDCEVTVYSKDAPSIKANLKVKITSASDKPDTEDGETQIITNVKPEAGTGDKRNDYTALIKPEVISEAIGKVVEEANGLKTTPVVKIKVETPVSAVNLVTSIPYASVGKLITESSKKGVLEVETGIGTMRLNAEALQRIYSKAYSNADIELKMSRTVKNELNEEQQKAVGTRSVVELSIRSAGKEISSFDGHPITISLPFTLSSNQSGKGAQVDHLTAYGGLEPLKTDYNYKTKCVYFDITHLSYFSPYYQASVAWDNPFTDVKNKDWFYDSVFYVVDRKLMQGISAERFVPESITTRGQIVTILHRLAGLPATKEANTFKDVKDGQWYTDAILWATENGLVNGYGGGLFGPEDEVTREQLGVMLHNYAKYVDITPKYGWDTPMRYPDSNKVSSWARQGAMYCQITRIITGRPGGGFEPQGTATRAELSTMLLRMNDQMQKQLETQS